MGSKAQEINGLKITVWQIVALFPGMNRLHLAPMQQGLFLSRFSQPQAVILLLVWLRLLVTALLLSAYGLLAWLGEPMLSSLLQWPRIMIFAGALLALSLLSQAARNWQLHNWHIFVVLLADILCWYGLVFASGGAINPAVSYLLVLLSVAALALPTVQAVALALVTVAIYAWMLQQMQGHAHHLHMFEWHLWGMWVLFLMTALIMLGVISLLSRAVREKDRAIARYREQTVRDEQLIALGTMAANVAHELGTPLSTIGLLVEDRDDEDAELMRQQLLRCKQALEQLKKIGTDGRQEEQISSRDFFQRLKQETLLLKPDADIRWQDEAGGELCVSPLLEQALLALINNAIEAAHQQVKVTLQQPDDYQLWCIHHDGDNIGEDLLQVLGQQVVQSRKQGMGIGYYLANASIEQLGGTVQISNCADGVETRVRLPLESKA